MVCIYGRSSHNSAVLGGPHSRAATSVEGLLYFGNKFETLTADVARSLPTGCFSRIKTLAVSRCGMSSWTQVEVLESLLSSVEELYLNNNSLADLPVHPARGFVHMRVLDLTNCGLSLWSQVLSLGLLPSLRELILDENPLKEPSTTPENMFRGLTRLSLEATAISSWKEVNTLSSFRSLLNLRLTNIPLLAGMGPSEYRALIIGRLSTLTFLNGSTISPKERINAEHTYLRKCMREGEEMTKGGATAADVERSLAEEHPRYKELSGLYAKDLVLAGAAKTAGTLSADLVQITFKNLSFSSGGSLEPMTKKLPASLQVSRLKLMVKQLFGLDPHIQRLSIRVYKDALPVLLDDDDATLAYYGGIDGAEIFINEAKA